MPENEAWAAHTAAVSKEEVKGSITVIKKGWTCNYCDTTYWNHDLKRLRVHLTGDQLQCRGCKIAPCTAAPEDVQADMTAMLASSHAQAGAVAKRKSTNEELADEAAQGRAQFIQRKIPNCRKTVDTIEVDGAILDMFDGLGIAHAKVEHPLFQRAIRSIRNAPSDYKLPGRTTLGGSILEQQYQCNVDERSKHLQHEQVKKFGMTTTTDGATLQKTPLLNLIMICAVWSHALFLLCKDCTDHLADGGSKDAEFIADVMIMAIRSLPYPRYVDLIITDGAGDMMKFIRLLTAVFPWIYAQWCVSHLCNCIMKKVSTGLPKLEEHIEKGKKIVDRFSNHHAEHAMFTRMSKAMHCDLAIIRYCDTRFGLYFLMLHRLHVLKQVLKAVIHSTEYRAKKRTSLMTRRSGTTMRPWSKRCGRSCNLFASATNVRSPRSIGSTNMRR